MQICFDSYYDCGSGNFYLNKDEFAGMRSLEFDIADCYEIEVIIDEFTGRYKAYERGGRLRKFSEENDLDLYEDLHVNGAGDLCVSPKNIEKYQNNSTNEELFINQLLIPFLYSNSYYEKNGQRPWPDYDHNEKGYFEAYIREGKDSSKKRVLNNLFSLKDAGFDLKVLSDREGEYFQQLQSDNSEAYDGAMLLIQDIEKYNLGKFIS